MGTIGARRAITRSIVDDDVPSVTGARLAEWCVALPSRTANNEAVGDESRQPAQETDARARLLAHAAASIDAVLPERALLYGSAPPDARDLDLVVSERGAEAAAGALADAGFTQRGRTWARFDGCVVGVVELLPAASLRLPPPLIEAVLEQGTPLPGLRHVVVPAPHHDVALLARRVRHSTRLEPKHLRRLERALRADPAAWHSASAADPGAADDVARLRRLARGEVVGRRPLRRGVRLPRVLAVAAPDADRAVFHARTLADAADALGYSGEVVGPGRWTTPRAWAAVLRRLGSGGAVVVASAAPRSPRLAPPALVEFVLASAVPERGRVRQVDPGLPAAAACERIAASAWEALASGGRLRSASRRLRGRAPVTRP